jgi:pantoate--beta-alanine ligase
VIRILTTPEELVPFAGCAFVPTMGALHEGHLALIRRAREVGAGPVVISIFVNPTQFGPKEDFSGYPRDLEGDLRKAESAGADAAFVPEVATMYPPGETIAVPPLPEVATRPGLEDAHRPGHFAGVCQVVARLFDLVKPSLAIFGEKDWQQLKVIEAMVRHEGARWDDLSIISHPTVREADGLAMSSRNVFLSKEERQRALAIPSALLAAQAEGPPRHDDAEFSMRRMLEASGLRIDYAVLRHSDTLLGVVPIDLPARALIAVRIGNVRLIDNAPWNASMYRRINDPAQLPLEE